MRLPNLSRLSLRPTGQFDDDDDDEPSDGEPLPKRLCREESEDTVLSDDDEDGEFELPVEEGKAKVYEFRWRSEERDKPDCELRFVAECLQTPWRTLDTDVDFKLQEDDRKNEVVWLHISLASKQKYYSDQGSWAIAVPLVDSPTRRHADKREALQALIAKGEPLEAYAAKYEAGRECVGHRRLVARYLIATDYILNDLLPGAPAIAVEQDIAIADRFEPAKLLDYYKEHLQATGGDVNKALDAAYFATDEASYWRSRYYQLLGANAYFEKDGVKLHDDEAIRAAVIEMVVRMRANPVLQRWREEVKAAAAQQPPQPPGLPKKQSTHEYWPTAYGVRFRMPLTGARERLVAAGRVQPWAGDVRATIHSTTRC